MGPVFPHMAHPDNSSMQANKPPLLTAQSCGDCCCLLF